MRLLMYLTADGLDVGWLSCPPRFLHASWNDERFPMIALVNLLTASRSRGREILTSLPEPPALRWSAFMVRIIASLPFEAFVAWAVAVRATRPFVPIGLVADLDASTMTSLSILRAAGLSLDPILSRRDTPGGRLLVRHMDHLAEASVEQVVFGHWLSQWPIDDREARGFLRAAAAVGVRGGKAYRVELRDLHGRQLSRSTVDRRLKELGVPTLGWLVGNARVRSVAIRLRLGMDRRDAISAAGWTSVKGYKNAVARRLPEDIEVA